LLSFSENIIFQTQPQQGQLTAHFSSRDKHGLSRKKIKKYISGKIFERKEVEAYPQLKLFSGFLQTSKLSSPSQTNKVSRL
jgi:hypothetical protein